MGKGWRGWGYNQKLMVVSVDIFHILCNTPCIAVYCLELNTTLCRVLASHKHFIKERLLNDPEIKTREQNKTKDITQKEIPMNVAFWLVIQTLGRKKTSCPITSQKLINTSL